MPQALISIHGVNSRGSWYPPVEQVLGKHFTWSPIRYSGYERYGKTKLALFNGGLYGGLALIAVAIVVWLCRPPQHGPLLTATLCFCLVTAALLLGGCWAERLRRKKALRCVEAQVRTAIKDRGPRPHVVAHSFGTHLLGEVLKNTDLRFHCIILTGSILPRYYPWAQICWSQSRHVSTFKEVRNEMGLRDLVVRIAPWARPLVGGCGSSGQGGFAVRRAARGHSQSRLPIHEIRGPLGPCDPCDGRRGGKPKLHNVPLEHYGHDFPGHHAREMWLPVLWDMEPCDLVRFCETSAELEEVARDIERDEFRAKLDEFGNHQYGWTHLRVGARAGIKLCLKDFVELVLRQQLDLRSSSMREEGIRDLVDETILWAGRLARAALSTEASEALAPLAHPRRAVSAAAIIAAEAAHKRA